MTGRGRIYFRDRLDVTIDMGESTDLHLIGADLCR